MVARSRTVPACDLDLLFLFLMPVGVDYPIALKLSFSDLVSDSSTPEEMLWVCKELEKKGIDFIEVSSGISADSRGCFLLSCFKETATERANFLESALLVSDTLEIPVSSVGCYRSPDFIEHILSSTSYRHFSWQTISKRSQLAKQNPELQTKSSLYLLQSLL